jgi:thioredoxin reductase (NADPH)
MADRVLKNPKIVPIWNNEVVEIKGGQHIEKLVLKNTISENAETELEVKGLFVAIGHVPNSQFVKGLIETDKSGYIITNEKKETNVEGIWAAGDVQDPYYRQAITAAGSGCMAALNVEKWLH